MKFDIIIIKLLTVCLMITGFGSKVFAQANPQGRFENAVLPKSLSFLMTKDSGDNSENPNRGVVEKGGILVKAELNHETANGAGYDVQVSIGTLMLTSPSSPNYQNIAGPSVRFMDLPLGNNSSGWTVHLMGFENRLDGISQEDDTKKLSLMFSLGLAAIGWSEMHGSELLSGGVGGFSLARGKIETGFAMKVTDKTHLRMTVLGLDYIASIARPEGTGKMAFTDGVTSSSFGGNLEIYQFFSELSLDHRTKGDMLSGAFLRVGRIDWNNSFVRSSDALKIQDSDKKHLLRFGYRIHFAVP